MYGTRVLRIALDASLWDEPTTGIGLHARELHRALTAKGARVVKVFNTTGFNVMLDPKFGNEAATMFHCGDDAEAKAVAARLSADLGFEPFDAGPLSQSDLLEHLALLWISTAIAHGHGRDMAFRMVKR